MAGWTTRRFERVLGLWTGLFFYLGECWGEDLGLYCCLGLCVEPTTVIDYSAGPSPYIVDSVEVMSIYTRCSKSVLPAWSSYWVQTVKSAARHGYFIKTTTKESSTWAQALDEYKCVCVGGGGGGGCHVACLCR